jgi:hypothetical protein
VATIAVPMIARMGSISRKAEAVTLRRL